MKPKTTVPWLIIIITLGVVLLLALAVVLSSTQNPDPNATAYTSSELSSSEVSSSTSESQIEVPSWDEYIYAGSKADGSLALFSADGREIALSLETKGWKKPLWSEDGRTLAVLAKQTVESDIYDLYTYSVDGKSLRQLTDFTPTGSGITNYYWLNNDTLIFDKETSGSNWLHRYDLTSSQLTKLYILTGNLWRLASGDQVAVITASSMEEENTGKDFYLQDLGGDTLARIWGYKIAGQTWVLDVIPNIEGSSYFINAITLYEEDEYMPTYVQYVWSLDEPTYTEIPKWSSKEASIICDHGDKYIGLEQGEETLSIYQLSVGGMETTAEELASFSDAWKDRTICTEDSILVPLQLEDEISWLEVDLETKEIKEIAGAGKFIEVVKR